MIDWDAIAAGLVGTPFKWGARGPDAQDCWGLVAKAYEVAGVGVPGNWLAETQDEASDMMDGQVRDGMWKRLDAHQPGAVVALSSHKRIHHVGLRLTRGRILHTTRKLGAVITTELALRTAGYRRIEDYVWAR